MTPYAPSSVPETPQVTLVAIDTIRLSRDNPRRHFDPVALAELTGSIRNQGLLQPILVRQTARGLEIVAGERRYRACVAAGLAHIPVIVREFDDRAMLEVALVENLQRENLNPLEEAESFRRLLDDFGYTQEALAAALGKDRTTISNTIRLLKLPAPIQELVRTGQLSQGHARALLALSTDRRRLELAKSCAEGKLTVRQLEREVQRERKSTPRQRVSASHVEAMQRTLSTLLQTGVTLAEQGKRGVIHIEYASLDEFERLLELFQRGAGVGPDALNAPDEPDPEDP